MAAFIKKLFKSKNASKPAPTHPTEQTAKDLHQPDTRDTLREQQNQMLNNGPDQQQLATLAVEGVTADIRLNAAKQLADPDCLQQVQKNAKGKDKGVYQAVRQTIQSQREAKAREEARSALIANLIQSAQEQARSEDTKLYAARLEALQAQWQEVEQHASAEQVQDFWEARRQCQERLDTMQQVRDEEARHTAQKQQRAETLDLLKTTLNDLRTHSPDDLPSLSSLDALQKTQENRWLEATRDTAVPDPEKKAYNESMLALRTYVSAVRRIAQHKDALSALTAAQETAGENNSDLKTQAQDLVEQISWPEGYPLPGALQAAQKLAQKQPPAQAAPSRNEPSNDAIVAELEKTITNLENALEGKQLKESRQLLKAAQSAFKRLNQRERKAFQARIQRLNGQVNELSDWLGFATEPKQIALCEQMEYLAEQPMEPEAKADRIKDLQKEWRELGGSSDRALWTRFKEASDRAFEPCRDYFSAKSGLKQSNLEKRQKICDELETFLTQADWSAMDWKGAEKIHHTARQEWKAAWPVEFRDNRAVQKRFDDLLKRLEAPLDQEREKNEAQKKAIVEKAQALIEQEPLQDAINQAKDLQQEWKTIGITRHREDRKLWQAFRRACDQIFDRRDAQRNAHKEAIKAADEAATQALDDIGRCNESSAQSKLSDGLQRLNTLLSSDVSSTTREKLKAEVQRLKQALARQAMGETISHWQGLVAQSAEAKLDESAVPAHWPELARHLSHADYSELAIRAEILSGVESPAEEQQRRMEIQVRRLADGMGASEPSGSKMEELEKLVAGWCVDNASQQPDQSLTQRMSKAISALAGD
ncbi:DUF349 domain-containing protein [Marinobacter salinisoli]|uniref:DUF349 domain-containing protein n=1 Tax=Marinobacter salinisoli TaxID=2769486 RepID=A0ABX7MQ06_9GAMM|nr:DUF349 domain-containing protein [Marinobacter salinisoli]QSP94283.1 DUF349 domain-containing protein [Marinobacter salinisoli]